MIGDTTYDSKPTPQLSAVAGPADSLDSVSISTNPMLVDPAAGCNRLERFSL